MGNGALVTAWVGRTNGRAVASPHQVVQITDGGTRGDHESYLAVKRACVEASSSSP
ncbi:hypothetical protein C8T65DRAFT_639078, partial [Cerioporus squamosus]